MEQGEALITTRSEQETEYIGALTGQNIQGPLAVALRGELGTGKTVFVRGVARSLGVPGHVSSPTFVLMQVYRGRWPVYHFDFYRLQEANELEALDLEEYLPGDGVALVEWAERFPGIFPTEFLQIELTRLDDERGEGRRIRLTPRGSAPAALVEMVMERIVWRVDGTLHRIPLFPVGKSEKELRNC